MGHLCRKKFPEDTGTYWTLRDLNSSLYWHQPPPILPTVHRSLRVRTSHRRESSGRVLRVTASSQGQQKTCQRTLGRVYVWPTLVKELRPKSLENDWVWGYREHNQKDVSGNKERGLLRRLHPEDLLPLVASGHKEYVAPDVSDETGITRLYSLVCEGRPLREGMWSSRPVLS